MAGVALTGAAAEPVADELVAREPGAPTSIDLLKVDVQGYSLPVLRGAERALGPNTVIASEVDLLDIHRGASLLDEVLAWAGFRDFVVFDIAGLSRRPLDKALWQVDLTGRNERRLPTPVDASDPAWGPIRQ